jgi:hypothetical protein
MTLGGDEEMTYLTRELETVRVLKEEMLRRRRRQALINAVQSVETVDTVDNLVQLLGTNSVSIDWAEAMA